MRRAVPTVLAAATCTAVLLGSCAVDPGVTVTRADTATAPAGSSPSAPTTDPTAGSAPGSSTSSGAPSTTSPTSGGTSEGPDGPYPDGQFPWDPDKPPQDYDRYLVAAVEDIQSYWETEYPALFGTPFEEVAGGIHPAYPGMAPITGCGEPSYGYQDVKGNAFYCGVEDYLAYDDHQLFPQLDKDFGRSVLGMVMAHEMGHAIQSRQGLLDGRLPTVITELQADCYAGAWSAHVAGGGSDTLGFGDEDVVAGLNGLIFVADPVGTVSAQPGAHGSAFDRVSAYQDGFLTGPERCAGYVDDPPTVIQLPFTAGELTDPERRDPGDAPYSSTQGTDIFTLATDDLTRFWTATLSARGITLRAPTLTRFGAGDTPTCGDMPTSALVGTVTYCPDSREILLDDDLARSLYDTIGDFAVAYLLGEAYAEAVLDATGSRLTGEERALRGDCLTGAWTHDIIPDPNRRQDATISAGDLDEAVQTALSIGDPGADDDVRGSAFEKIDAYRTGVFGGISACTEGG